MHANEEPKPVVMVVDDQIENVQVMAGALDRKGYDLRLFTSGVAALEAAQEEAPDLILLDISMPDIDGFEFCSRLKEADTGNDTSVVFLTAAYPDKDHVLQGLALGAVDYITKPVDLQIVAARVASHLELRLAHKRVKAAEAFQSTLISILGHDLRNPISGIVGLLSVVQQHPDRFSEQDYREMYGEVLEAGTRLQRLVDNLLDWAEASHDRVALTFSETDLQQLVAAEVQLVEIHAQRKGVTVEATVDPATVVTDHRLVSTVARNLLQNAVKFTPSGGTVSISVRENRGGIDLVVTDTGVGMSPERAKTLFCDTVSSRNGTDGEKGSGLGLQITRQFVRLLDGTVQVSSEEGAGSTFTVAIPPPRIAEVAARQ